MFLEAGKFSNFIGYLTEGVLRIFETDAQGEEITRYFLSEGQFAAHLESFTDQEVCGSYYEALTDCELLLISRDNFLSLSQEIRHWDRIVRLVTEKMLLEKLANRSDLVYQDATTKYQNFIRDYPHLANRIPLMHLASYLGIKQQSLSRIRRSLAQS